MPKSPVDRSLKPFRVPGIVDLNLIICKVMSTDHSLYQGIDISTPAPTPAELRKQSRKRWIGGCTCICLLFLIPAIVCIVLAVNLKDDLVKSVELKEDIE